MSDEHDKQDHGQNRREEDNQAAEKQALIKEICAYMERMNTKAIKQLRTMVRAIKNIGNDEK